MRDYPHPEDLGLDPQADRTEDLRPGNNDGPSAGTPRPSESTIQQETEKGRSMTTVNPYPVDSATRPCCGGIGGHSRECTKPATWRDYTDTLPANVVRSFEKAEYLAKTQAHMAFPGEDPAEVLRTVQGNILDEVLDQHLFANVKLPAGIEGSMELDLAAKLESRCMRDF